MSDFTSATWLIHICDENQVREVEIKQLIDRWRMCLRLAVVVGFIALKCKWRHVDTSPRSMAHAQSSARARLRQKGNTAFLRPQLFFHCAAHLHRYVHCARVIGTHHYHPQSPLADTRFQFCCIMRKHCSWMRWSAKRWMFAVPIRHGNFISAGAMWRHIFGWAVHMRKIRIHKLRHPLASDSYERNDASWTQTILRCEQNGLSDLFDCVKTVRIIESNSVEHLFILFELFLQRWL